MSFLNSRVSWLAAGVLAVWGYALAPIVKDHENSPGVITRIPHPVVER
jgi:hypothetical protein